MPREVAGAYQLAVFEKYDERRAIALSSEAAAHYLADLHDRFGSWDIAILAFGLRYSEALRVLSGHAAANFQAIAAGLGPDDAAYVPRVLATAVVLANPDRFGLDAVGPVAPITTSDLEVPGGTPLSTVARAAGTSVETLRDLNPEYLGNTVPDTGFAMVMHLPSNSLARAKEALMPMLYATSGSALSRGEPIHDRPDAGEPAPIVADTAPKSGGGRRIFYHARDGETLDAIASRFGIARETIASDNALDPTAPLRAGQLLTLRLGAAAGGASRTSK
jgi:membrane-bound lytic murein transglycosylase D